MNSDNDTDSESENDEDNEPGQAVSTGGQGVRRGPHVHGGV